MKRGELGLVFLTLLFVAGLVFADLNLEQAPAGTEAQTSLRGSFLSTGWYCPTPTGSGYASSVVTANLGENRVQFSRWATGKGLVGSVQRSDLGIGGVTVEQVANLGAAEPVAVVEAFGDRTVTTVESLNPTVGASGTSCSTEPRDTWFFGTASTARRKDSHLLMANPFLEEARVKVRLLTPDGLVEPSKLLDFLVPRLTQTAVFLGDHFRETEAFGVEIVATRGRPVIARQMTFATRDGVRGTLLGMGALGPQARWLFPTGEVPTDGEEGLYLANPTDKEALIEVEFITDQEHLLQPALREVAVPAQRQVSIGLSQHLPRGTRHSTGVRSVNGVPVVAEVLTTGSLAGFKGVDSILGSEEQHQRWAVTLGSPAGGRDTLEITNFGEEPAVISVRILTSKDQVRPPNLTNKEVPSNTRTAIEVTDLLAGGIGVAEVEAVSGSVVVGRHLVVGDPYRDFVNSMGVSF